MANEDTAFGLKPCGNFSGERPYAIVPGTTKIFIHDPVKKDSTGTAGGLSTVDIAGGTGAFLGSVTKIFDDTGKSVSYYPAGSATGYTCMVADGIEQEFEMQEDGDTTPLAQADIGLNVNMIAGSGSTVTGYSKWEIDSTSKATTATHQLRLLRMVQRSENAIGAYAKWVVKINNHANAAGTGTVGV